MTKKYGHNALRIGVYWETRGRQPGSPVRVFYHNLFGLLSAVDRSWIGTVHALEVALGFVMNRLIKSFLRVFRISRAGGGLGEGLGSLPGCVLFLTLCTGCVFWGGVGVVRGEDSGRIDYQSQVKSLLRERCFACHGPLKQEGSLRLDTLSSMLTGGDSGPAILPKDTEGSLLLKRIRSAEIENRMPPEHEGEAMKSQEIELLQRWIENGAEGVANEQPEPDPRLHWAFQAVRRPQVPLRQDVGGRQLNPIDAFLTQVHQEHQLQGADRASNEVLLRRLSFDLIGLPPDLAELKGIPSEWSDDWYRKQVDRLLMDPRHGERWARHWMDVWRFSDWWGLGDQLRNSQLHMWHWRDWIIENINADRPYDEMVRLMLAADEIRPEDIRDLRATGFLARNYFLFNRNQWMDETIEHVSKAFLGLTMNCAKCHDHKYDPIQQTDYYRMRAIFEPYHVRLDQVEGESDLNKNGLPRVFDTLLDTPTYRFIRGEESNPDKSTAMTPSIPEFFSGIPFEVQPVRLPGVAWQPERRAWVIPAVIERARAEVAVAEKNLENARTAMQKASEEHRIWKAGSENSDKAPTDTELLAKELLRENFQALDPLVWQTLGGDWKFEPGKLEQLRDGQDRSVLRWLGKPPKDFDVTLKFTIQGGSTYRSVGITFDSTQEGSEEGAKGLAPGPQDSEVMVYLSAHAPDPKVQGAYATQGAYHYPAEGRVSVPVMLQKPYTLRVQVRGDLVNAHVDGEPKLAWKIPIGRREGGLRFTAFDVQVAFHEIVISTLPASVVMREPSGTVTLDPEAQLGISKSEMELSEQRLANARLDVEVLQARHTAWLARWAFEDGELAGETQESLEKLKEHAAQTKIASLRMDRRLALGKAKERLLAAKIQQAKSTPEKKDAADKEVAAAMEGVANGDMQLQNALSASEPEGEIVRFVGAKWSATRFLNSGADDPAVEFRATSSGRRTALANWITDRRNPLTARVAVNHLWSRHFGEPLVATVFDFGNKGAKSEHVQLLDWLACELMEHGWSMKHVHRLILDSEHYRRDSRVGAEGKGMELDPDNRFMWRRIPQRMESQVVRDSILAFAGRLDGTIGGVSVAMKDQANSMRRSLYFFHSNNERNLLLTTFDEALVKECYRREQSIVPQQALALSNSKLVLENCEPIADRISAIDDSDEEFMKNAFLWLLGIRADEQMLAASRAAMGRWKEMSDTGLGQGHPQRERVLLVWALLNHNDFVTLR